MISAMVWLLFSLVPQGAEWRKECLVSNACACVEILKNRITIEDFCIIVASGTATNLLTLSWHESIKVKVMSYEHLAMGFSRVRCLESGR